MKTFIFLTVSTLLTTGLYAQTTPTTVKKTTTVQKTTISRPTTTPAKPGLRSTATADPAPAEVPALAQPAPSQPTVTAPSTTAKPGNTTNRATSASAPARQAAPPTPASAGQTAAAPRSQPQTSRSQPGAQFGIIGGVTLANMFIKLPGGSETEPTLTGFHGGLVLNLPLGRHFAIQPGLMYVMKGTGKSQNSFFGKQTLHYAELPVTLFYVLPTGAGQFRIGAGGYVGYGLAGQNELGDKITFGTDANADANPLDYGARGAVQFQLNGGLLIGADYSYGFANLIPMASGSGVSVTNRAIGISLGYLFGGR